VEKKFETRNRNRNLGKMAQFRNTANMLMVHKLVKNENGFDHTASTEWEAYRALAEQGESQRIHLI
jgi:hypothetical protein